MKPRTRAILVILAGSVAVGVVFSQKQPEQKKATAAQQQTSSPHQLGESYATLRPEQKQLIDDYVRRYNQTMGSKLVAQQVYEGGRLSMRTTFDAVTHALLSTKLTDPQGKSLGRAIDLVEAVDDVMGEEAGVGGDRQYRTVRVLDTEGGRHSEPQPTVLPQQGQHRFSQGVSHLLSAEEHAFHPVFDFAGQSHV
jgi:hypothetical protein